MLVLGERISCNQESVFVVSNEVIVQNGHAIPERAELFFEDLIEQLPIVVAIALHVKGVVGVEGGLDHRVDVCDLGDQLSGIVTSIQIDLVNLDFSCSCPRVQNKVPSFDGSIEDYASDAIALVALLEDGLGEYFIMREVGDAL